jgi:hypothetical protein
MSPWAWTLASVGLTAILSLRASGLTLLLLAQAALFMLMWWFNARRQDRKSR